MNELIINISKIRKRSCRKLKKKVIIDVMRGEQVKRPVYFKTWNIVLSIIVSVAVMTPLYAAEKISGVFGGFGILSLLPPLVAIALAFISKNVILSLFAGVYTGCFMQALGEGYAFYALFEGILKLSKEILGALAKPWNAGIILQCLAIGGLIALISKTGGARAIAEALSKRARSPRSSQFVTWLMGLFIFFDDYANSLTVGPIMRPVTDRMRISREKLAFIVDATAAPIAGMAIISTWVAYELGIIHDGYALIGLKVNAFGIFVQTIPYRFYNILMLFFVVCTIIFLREFGPMHRAETRARQTGKVINDEARPLIAEETTALEPPAHIRPVVWDALVPICTLIGVAFLGFYINGYRTVIQGTDKALAALLEAAPLSFEGLRIAFGKSDASLVLFQAALIAGIVTIFMAILKRNLNIKEALETWLTGVKSMNITAVVLLLAWALAGVIKKLGTAAFLVSVLSDSVPAFLLPSIIFILGSAISFATGTSYGTMGILMPLAIPLAYAMKTDPGFLIINVGAVLTGAIFGDHCSPISDTTILSSMGAACDHLDHTRTQIIYALAVAGVTIVFGYIPAGLGFPIYIILPAGLAAIAVIVRFVGRPVDI